MTARRSSAPAARRPAIPSSGRACCCSSGCSADAAGLGCPRRRRYSDAPGRMRGGRMAASPTPWLGRAHRSPGAPVLALLRGDRRSGLASCSRRPGRGVGGTLPHALVVHLPAFHRSDHWCLASAATGARSCRGAGRRPGGSLPCAAGLPAARRSGWERPDRRPSRKPAAPARKDRPLSHPEPA